jgi:hypothetical protein
MNTTVPSAPTTGETAAPTTPRSSRRGAASSGCCHRPLREIGAGDEERLAVRQPRDHVQIPVELLGRVDQRAALDRLEEDARWVKARLGPPRAAEGQESAVG